MGGKNSGGAADGSDELHQLIRERLEKAEKIRASGANPYANDFKPELSLREFWDRYGEHHIELSSDRPGLR